MRSLSSLLHAAALSLAIAGGLAGCRGWTSDQPPVHLNPNMDTQPKHKAYRDSDFFADRRSMRTPPAGTVARTVAGDTPRDADFLRTDDRYYTALEGGQTMRGLPERLAVTPETLVRGQERYNIYCAPCHARHGNGMGTVASRLRIKPPNFHTEPYQAQRVAHFYRIITHGKPLPEDRADPSIAMNMPAYAAQIPVEDRWAIALYVRALQQSQYSGGAIPVDGIGSAAPAVMNPSANGTPPAPPATGDGSTP